MSFSSLLFTLFLIQDPIGNIPICLNLLRQLPNDKHLSFIVRENAIAFILACGFLLGGHSLLNYLHLSPESLQLAGGYLLFLVAVQMIFPSNQPVLNINARPFLVPLATPLLAGPSMLATLTLYSAREPHGWALGVIAIAINAILSTTVLLTALPLQKYIKPHFLQALERLMGVILLSTAIQMILDGFQSYFKLIR